MKKEKAKIEKKARRKGLDPKSKNNKTTKQSKFSSKYSERIKSIKESEEKYKKEIEK